MQFSKMFFLDRTICIKKIDDGKFTLAKKVKYGGTNKNNPRLHVFLEVTQ
jgi:hypothetical protein